MEKINIAELLKDCPQGMELDCTIWDNIAFEEIGGENIVIFRKSAGAKVYLTQYGEFNSIDGKCIIFPKGKTTWEGFQRPFKDGDIVTWEDGGLLVACIIYKERKNSDIIRNHLVLYGSGFIQMNEEIFIKDDKLRFASEEEKEKLFQAIKDKGYKWNEETKNLEKLVEPMFKDRDIPHIKSGKYYLCIRNLFDEFCNIIFHKGDTYYSPEDGYLIPSNSNVPYKIEYFTDEYFRTHETKTLIKPKFKVGDKVRFKKNHNVVFTITNIDEDSYISGAKVIFCLINDQDQYELVPNKFDITTLKPFDKVLVRNNNKGRWHGQFYMSYDKNEEYPFECTYNCWIQCIPFEGNEHLLDTTDNCSEYYRVWKE